MSKTAQKIDEPRMPVWQHLDDLRQTIIHCAVALLLGVCVTYSFSERIVHFLELPLLDVLPPSEAHLYFTGITDKFFTYLKVSFYTAIAATSPYLLYQLWKFISPALRPDERRFMVPFLAFATTNFVIGLVFAYTFIIPYGYRFLIQFGSPNEKAIITLNEYFSLTTQLMMTMGLVFELPVVLVLLGKFGIIQYEMLIKIRRQAYVALTVVAAVMTPTPDAMTMIMVLIPLWLLYELSVVLIRWVGTKKVSETPAEPTGTPSSQP